MKRTCLFYLVCIGALAACDVPDKPENAGRNKLSEPDIAIERVTINDSDLVLNSTAEQTSLTLDDHLFGKFFYDRAAFYVLSNPDKSIYGSSIKSLVLCYLDGELAQLKYETKDNITDKVINEHGNSEFKITACDDANKKILQAENVITRVNGKLAFQKKLTNYQLRFYHSNVEIIIRVDNGQYYYFERTKNYRLKFYQVETSRGPKSVPSA